MVRGNGRRGIIFAGAFMVFALHTVVDFAMPANKARPQSVPTQSGGARRARDDMPRQVLEIPLEEPEPEEEPSAPMQEKRVPYAVNYFIHSDHAPDHDQKGSNFKYMSRKLELALENCQDMIEKVDVRLTIESHAHKTVGGSKKKAPQSEVAVVDDDDAEGYVAPAADSGDRQILAPYRMEVTVKMHEGYLVLSKSKHAQGSFTEVVDHMYDTLRRQMRKEKEKRIDARRAAASSVEIDVGDPMDGVDEDMREINMAEEARLDAEAEAEYAQHETKESGDEIETAAIKKGPGKKSGDVRSVLLG